MNYQSKSVFSEAFLWRTAWKMSGFVRYQGGTFRYCSKKVGTRVSGCGCLGIPLSLGKGARLQFADSCKWRILQYTLIYRHNSEMPLLCCALVLTYCDSIGAASESSRSLAGVSLGFSLQSFPSWSQRSFGFQSLSVYVLWRSLMARQRMNTKRAMHQQW